MRTTERRCLVLSTKLVGLYQVLHEPVERTRCVHMNTVHCEPRKPSLNEGGNSQRNLTRSQALLSRTFPEPFLKFF